MLNENYVVDKTKYLLTFSNKSYHDKFDAKLHSGEIWHYLKNSRLKRQDSEQKNDEYTIEQVRNMIFNRVFKSYSYNKSTGLKSDVSAFAANVIALDYDGKDLDSNQIDSKVQQRRIKAIIHAKANLIQESTRCSADSYRAHFIIHLNTVITDPEIYAKVVEKVRSEFETELDCQIDNLPIYQLSYPSCKPVWANYKLTDYNVDSVLDEIKAEEIKAEQDIKQKEQKDEKFVARNANTRMKDLISNQIVQNTNSKKFGRNTTTIINLSELKALYSSDYVRENDYQTRLKFILLTNVLVQQHLIDDDTQSELFDLIESDYKYQYHDRQYYSNLAKQDVSDLSLATLNYLSAEGGFNHIFSSTQTEELRADKTIQIDDYISNSKNAFYELNSWIGKNAGKQLLITAQTGSGKTQFLKEFSKKWIQNTINDGKDDEINQIIMSMPRVNLLKNVMRDFIQSIPSSVVQFGSQKQAKEELRKNGDNKNADFLDRAVKNPRFFLTSVDMSVYKMKSIINRQKTMLENQSSAELDSLRSDLKQAKAQKNLSLATYRKREKLGQLLDEVQIEKEIEIEKQQLFENAKKQLKCGYSILVQDEAHMIATDSSFREIITTYRKTLNEFLKLGNRVINITATPRFLDYSSFDYVLKFEQKNRKNVYNQVDYYLSRESNNDLNAKFLANIEKSIKNGNTKVILGFVENIDTVLKMTKQLNQDNINAVPVYSDARSQKAKEIVSGKIPTDTKVILTTTSLSAGLSIMNDTSSVETWILMSNKSLNYSNSMIQQMSNRFRNQYQKMVLFIQQAAKSSDKKFKFQNWLNRIKAKSLNGAILANNIRNQNGVYPEFVDELEKSGYLMTDFDNQVIANVDSIVGDLVQSKVRANRSNTKEFLVELQHDLNCKFVEFSTEDELELEKEVGSSKKDILKALLNDSEWDKQKKLYVNGERSAVNLLKGRAKEDVKLLIKFDDKISKDSRNNILKSHISKSAIASAPNLSGDIKVIKQIRDVQQETLISLVLNSIQQKIGTSEAKFNDNKEYSKFLDKILKNVQKKDLKAGQTAFKSSILKNYLVVSTKKSGSNRVKTIISIKNSQFLISRYHINANDAKLITA